MRRSNLLIFIMSTFFAKQIHGKPVECLHDGNIIGTTDFASVEQGLVSCQDPVTKILLKETLFKKWMVVKEKFFKNGALHREIAYDGIPGQNKYHGWKISYTDGYPTREELYEHGFPILQRIYFPNGQLKLATATIASNKSQKTRVEFDDQGRLISLQCSKAITGPKQKKWCGLDGNPSTVTLYTNGKENRKLTFQDGHLKVYEQLTTTQDSPQAQNLKSKTKFNHLQVENYSDGRKKTERRINFNGNLDGVQRHYEHTSESLVIEELFENGRLAESRIFYPNGRTKLHFLWAKVAGKKRFGSYRTYFSDGALESRGECYELVQKNWPLTFDAFPTFLKHGSSRSWDEDGEIREESKWKDGERDGTSNYYFRRAGKTRMTRAAYKNGKSQGEQEFMEIDGNWKPFTEGQLQISMGQKKNP
jgi:antitoxin component YwqK of YwqJK toxin-antitoxin module